MSFWITEMRCKKCGLTAQVSGGVIGLKDMAPHDKQLECRNILCDGKGYNNFHVAKNSSLVVDTTPCKHCHKEKWQHVHINEFYWCQMKSTFEEESLHG